MIDMDYEKKYNEALERARYVLHTVETAGCAMHKDLLTEIFPELRESESEDEQHRKWILEYLYDGLRKADEQFKEQFKSAIAWFEKQKEASKAIEAVDRIDKYIDDHLANAHDMKDSNPDKKYYRGWDDALGKMAGILQDVYSEKENKFAPRVLPCSAAWFEDGEEKQKEQKPVDWDDELEKCKKSPLYFFDKYVKIKLKSAEWSEEDEKMLNNTLDSLKRYQLSMPNFQVELQMRWLRSLRPQPKRDGGDDYNKGYIKGRADTLKEFADMSSWKPSEEQQEVDLKEETKEWANLMVGASFPEQDGDFISEEDYRSVIRQTALHFYELGKNSK